ncbi:golgin subfamily A member 6-like protein 22 [Amphiprion ocellaris]|uniref:golgin subfamily A member 6-like protein 22 n=1 Tax=Amphiprion ocellaris TaxID=80972 RepID=UPI0024116707|nr:golgin subfamily A member 6-like protein 22 [Amphiprion ocellaris]
MPDCCQTTAKWQQRTESWRRRCDRCRRRTSTLCKNASERWRTRSQTLQADKTQLRNWYEENLLQIRSVGSRMHQQTVYSLYFLAQQMYVRQQEVLGGINKSLSETLFRVKNQLLQANNEIQQKERSWTAERQTVEQLRKVVADKEKETQKILKRLKETESNLQEEIRLLQANNKELQEQQKKTDAVNNDLQEEVRLLQANNKELQEQQKKTDAVNNDLQEEVRLLQANNKELQEQQKKTDAVNNNLQEEVRLLQANNKELQEQQKKDGRHQQRPAGGSPTAAS